MSKPETAAMTDAPEAPSASSVAAVAAVATEEQDVDPDLTRVEYKAVSVALSEPAAEQEDSAMGSKPGNNMEAPAPASVVDSSAEPGTSGLWGARVCV